MNSTPYLATYQHDVTVTWGESDPFGLVYYPHILAWFNDAEHEFFRHIGYPIDEMVRADGTTFVMGDVKFRFLGPSLYGDPVSCTMNLRKIGQRTLHWDCIATNARTTDTITEGTAVRVYARLDDQNMLTSVDIPDTLRRAITERDV